MTKLTKKLTALVLLTSSAQVFAMAKAQFTGDAVQIQVMAAQPFADQDGAHLYAALKLPEKNEQIGKSKEFKISSGDLYIVCSSNALMPSAGSCGFKIGKGPNSVLDARNNVVRYTVTGGLAKELVEILQLNEQREFAYVTNDHSLNIHANANEFRLEFIGH